LVPELNEELLHKTAGDFDISGGLPKSPGSGKNCKKKINSINCCISNWHISEYPDILIPSQGGRQITIKII
jgi:hypothetical protein